MIEIVSAGVLAAIVGACLGSFVVTATLRATRSEQAIVGRSRCDGCGTLLGFAETLPVVSFLRARGACQACGHRIDLAHLLGEVLGGSIVLAAAFAAPPGRALVLSGLGLVLLAAAVFDARTRRLPDRLSFVTALICLSLAVWSGTVLTGLVSALITFLFLQGVRRGFMRKRHDAGLGFGDVKLAAALALWLGPATPWAIVLASVIGLGVIRTIRPADGRIAFGPMIVLSALAVGLVREGGWWPSWS